MKNSIFRIEQPGENRTPLNVAQDIVSLLRTEYLYNTADLCSLLLCDRQWIDRVVQREVRHILITKYFREYIAENIPLLPEEKYRLLHGFYFFSDSDFAQWWDKNAVAECKTKLLDISAYQKSGFSADLTNELQYHARIKPSVREKARHMEQMQSLLTEEGFSLYCSSLSIPKNWIKCEKPGWNRELPLTNLAKYQKTHFLHSNASAMQHMIRRGGIRIKIGSRALWLIPKSDGMHSPIAIPADIPFN